MDKGKKIAITVITIIILVLIVVLVTVVWQTKTEADNVAANDIQEDLINEENNLNESEEYLIDENSENETSEENIITDKEDSNITQNTAVETTTQNEYVGKEEQESNIENNGENEEEKVINLAKEAWGISPDSYTFTIDSKQGDIYTVSVSANATVIAYYDINPKTGEVVEK